MQGYYYLANISSSSPGFLPMTEKLTSVANSVEFSLPGTNVFLTLYVLQDGLYGNDHYWSCLRQNSQTY